MCICEVRIYTCTLTQFAFCFWHGAFVNLLLGNEFHTDVDEDDILADLSGDKGAVCSVVIEIFETVQNILVLVCVFFFCCSGTLQKCGTLHLFFSQFAFFLSFF